MSDGGPDIVIAARFNGPARSGNGGYTCGSLAERLPSAPGSAIEVTLRLPPPLETPMSVTGADGSVTMLRGEDVVAEARVVPSDVEPVEGVDADEASRAMLGYPGLERHPFPTCFACGPDRAEGDGLRIFPGPVGGDRGHVASLWVPAESQIGVPVTWAALDCVGGWSSDIEGRPAVLGRMTATVDSLPVAGDPHVVVGRHLGDDGRKSFTASTLYDADGRVIALAKHTWIQVDPSLFN
jgi:hypothetical protein